MVSQDYLAAVLKSLRFHGRSTNALEAIPERAWPPLLRALDSAHLTLAVGVRSRDSLPELVRRRIDSNLAANRVRHERLLAAQSRISDVLASRGIDYVVLKGLAQWPWYSDDSQHRPQYDIDIYLPGESLSAGAKAIRKLGYECVSNVLDLGADHLPVMIRKSGWTWRGDYYDPEMPFSLELHFRFWNPHVLRFDVEGVAQFWQRRVIRELSGLRFPTLDPADGLSYSALHLVRHLLGGDLRLCHVYEIAHFLERSAGDDAFWAHWHQTGLPACRLIEGIAFRLAQEWFHCDLPPAAAETIDRLPSSIQRWFSLFAIAPGPALDHLDKNELWLHFCLLNNVKDRRFAASRRLLPRRGTRVIRDAHLPPSRVGLAVRIRRAAFEATFLAGRVLHHLRTLVPFTRSAFAWWFAERAETTAHRFPADRKRSSGTAPL